MRIFTEHFFNILYIVYTVFGAGKFVVYIVNNITQPIQSGLNKFHIYII